MRTNPTTALIAVIASAAGLLTGWYTPALLPALAVGALAYVLTVVALAAVFRQNRDDTLAGTSLLLIRATAITLQTLAGAALHLLAALEAFLQQCWANHQQQKQHAAPTFIHAA